MGDEKEQGFEDKLAEAGVAVDAGAKVSDDDEQAETVVHEYSGDRFAELEDDQESDEAAGDESAEVDEQRS